MKNNKRKVLFLIHDLGQGGAEKVLVNLVNHMDREKYEIIVKGWDNTSILQDISSGQRQIVSLAVIVGLADIACNNTINIYIHRNLCTS